VLLFDEDASARCLAADFDVSRGGRHQVDRDTAAFAELIEVCGGRSFADVSPNGGRHVYVLWTRPRPLVEIRPLIRALCAFFPSLDPAPMLNPAAGCIRPPGARHRSGGHQKLTTPLLEAANFAMNPCGPEVWNVLLDRLSPDLPEEAGPVLPAEFRETSRAPGPGARLSDRVEGIARSGTWDPNRYRSPSEARQAVITAAAALGWSLADVAARVESGAWPGLAGLYARYSPRTRRTALGRDLRKANDHLARERTARNSNTRGTTHSGGIGVAVGKRLSELEAGSEYRWIRAWWNAVRATESTRWADRSGLSKRLVLRALGAMAQRRGSRVLEVGVRSLALACGLDHSTVSVVLRALRDELDPVIELLEPAKGERADRYTLRVPDAALHSAAWRRWKSGIIEAIHPVFRELGPTAALVHETLADNPIHRRDITRAAVLSPSTVDHALLLLAEHGLAERDPRSGWRRGPVHLDRVAASLGITDLVERLISRYRTERVAWREFLDRLGRRTPPRSRVAPNPREKPVWPTALTAPPPADQDEADYDRTLAGTGTRGGESAPAVDILQRELGATVLAAG
jgi:DNA-binding transcriptional ArsR family regulator